MFAELNWTAPGATELFVVLFSLGNLIAVLAFAVRGAILLRILAIVGAGLQAIFYAFVGNEPLWFGLFWKLLMVFVAFSFMMVLIRERMGRQFAPELRPFVHALDILTPGQLQKLVNVGEIRRAGAERGILAQGKVPGELFYLLAGRALLIKDGRELEVKAEAFLGEIAFISGQPATADVIVKPGAIYLAWPVDRLNPLLEKDPQIDIALRGLMNHDLARKLAVQPLVQQLSPVEP